MAPPTGSNARALEPEVSATVLADPNARGVFEFSGDPTDLVLRTLARRAKINLVLSPSVSGGPRRGLSMPEIDGAPTGVLDLFFQVSQLFTLVALSGPTEKPSTVNLRLEDKTAREVIEIICQSNDLVATEKNGVVYVYGKFDCDAAEAKDAAHRQKIRYAAYVSEGFTRAEAMQFLLGGGPLQADKSASEKLKSR